MMRVGGVGNRFSAVFQGAVGAFCRVHGSGAVHTMTAPDPAPESSNAALAASALTAV
jgi:hypothetical protein